MPTIFFFFLQAIISWKNWTFQYHEWLNQGGHSMDCSYFMLKTLQVAHELSSHDNCEHLPTSLHAAQLLDIRKFDNESVLFLAIL